MLYIKPDHPARAGWAAGCEMGADAKQGYISLLVLYMQKRPIPLYALSLCVI
jgi:hypothetical protein